MGVFQGVGNRCIGPGRWMLLGLSEMSWYIKECKSYYKDIKLVLYEGESIFFQNCYLGGGLGQFTRNYTQTMKRGFERCTLWHTTLLAKCSELYALSALLRK